MKDHLMDHLKKLGEDPIFFDTKKKLWKVIFHYITFEFFIIFFNIVDHEMNIRFCLMFYV